MPTMPISNESLFVGLTKAATLFTNAMFARTRGSGYPKTKEHGSDIVYSIEDATRVGVATQSGNRIYIDIIIDLKKAPYAAAYEWGKSEPYQITPKPGTMTPLMFSKERWPGYKPPPPAPDVFMFMEVTHKKIEANPFLRPTIDEKRAEITALIGKSFREAYIRSMGERRVEIK
jgi:hypothetical protein